MSRNTKIAVAILLLILCYAGANVAYYNRIGYFPDNPVMLIEWLLA